MRKKWARYSHLKRVRVADLFVMDRYLLHQFLWSTTNHRTDQYGGEAANRRRFLHEIVSRIRAEVRRPDGSPIMTMLRFSQFPPRFDDERGPPHAGRVHKTSAALGEFVTAMAAAGVDLFDCSTEEFWQPAFPEEHPTRTLAGWTELLSDVPSAAGGSVGSNCT